MSRKGMDVFVGICKFKTEKCSFSTHKQKTRVFLHCRMLIKKWQLDLETYLDKFSSNTNDWSKNLLPRCSILMAAVLLSVPSRFMGPRLQQ